MKNNFFIIILIIITGVFSFLGLGIIEDKLLFSEKSANSNIVGIKVFIKEDCSECTELNNYLKVYKKAGVEFGNISIKKYGGLEYDAHFDEYDITKLPFIVFSKELSKYETISSSWDDTFGYKNKNGEYIPTDIIPPYFDLKTKKVEGLIDIIYIGDKSCLECYKIDDITNILSKFGLKFNKINKFDIKSKKGLDLTKKYNIDIFPIIILSGETSLYKNFSYFWKTIGSIEDDGNYILRKPKKLGLKINN